MGGIDAKSSVPEVQDLLSAAATGSAPGQRARGTDMFTCIVCMRQLGLGEQSDEHVFPDAIGGTLVIRDVCRECNGRLGDRVDRGLVEHQAMQFTRKTLGIRSRSGRIPDPTARGRWIEGDDMGADLRGNERTVAWERGRFTVYLRPERRDDGTWVIKYPPHQETEAAVLKAKVEQRNPGRRVTTEAEVGGNISIDLTLGDNDWIPGALKTAYELTYHFSGSRYLADPTAALIRQVLTLPAPTAGAMVDSGLFFDARGPTAPPLSRILRRRPSVLGGAVFVAGTETLCYVKFYDNFEALLEVGREAHTPAQPAALVTHVSSGREVRLTSEDFLAGRWS
jgi:hypothetical protein